MGALLWEGWGWGLRDPAGADARVVRGSHPQNQQPLTSSSGVTGTGVGSGGQLPPAAVLGENLIA